MSDKRLYLGLVSIKASFEKERICIEKCFNEYMFLNRIAVDKIKNLEKCFEK